MRAALLLGLSACVSVSLDNKPCDSQPPECLEGYHCVAGVCVKGDATGGGAATGGGSAMGGGLAAGGGATGGGGVDAGVLDAGCPLDVDPAASSCASKTWYLSPSGSDTADGTTPATARLSSLAGLPIMPGHTILFLGGAYPAVPEVDVTLSGTASCPLLIRGEADGGSVLRDGLYLSSSRTVVRDLTFNTFGTDSIGTNTGVHHITVQRVHFETQPGSPNFPTHVHLIGCNDCTVRESTFADDDAAPIGADSASNRVTFTGNLVQMHEGSGVDIDGDGALIEGNQFSGTYASPYSGYFNMASTPNVVIARNVFHNLHAVNGDSALIWGPVRVVNNTFDNCTGNTTRPMIGGGALLQNNLFTDADWAVGTPQPDAGGYNIFDPSVMVPLTTPDGGPLGVGGTDRVATVTFDPSTQTPTAGSAAVDGADPSSPVPPGGGTRADVGAVERGATPLPDGRYCVLDGGF